MFALIKRLSQSKKLHLWSWRSRRTNATMLIKAFLLTFGFFKPSFFCVVKRPIFCLLLSEISDIYITISVILDLFTTSFRPFLDLFWSNKSFFIFRPLNFLIKFSGETKHLCISLPIISAKNDNDNNDVM